MSLVRTATGALVPVAPDLWIVDHHRVALGLHVRLRMTVVRLPDGDLLLYSPVPLDDALVAALDALGPVAHLVAPSGSHHLHAGAAQARWPQARLWGSPALPAKRPDLRFDAILEDADGAFQGVFDVTVLRGIPRLQEAVLFHRPSRSLLVCDLVIHVTEERHPLTVPLWCALGVWRRVGSPRAWRLWTKDRAALRTSVDRVLGWEVDRIVVAHGTIVEEEARARLAVAMSWLG
ncbi:MAG: DUF4336 domain-containing protein [Alphaproteobacteria bacterium]|nr:DUF4336 domain-containing protein [Alphaproteobacteria bacterium]